MKFRALPLLSILVVTACGSGDDDEQATPPGPVCVYFSELKPRDNDPIPAAYGDPCKRETPDNVKDEEPGTVLWPTLTIGCDRRLAVSVELGGETNNWTFRQPNACSSAVQCGYVVIELDPDPSSTAPPTPCDPAAWMPDMGFPDPTVSSCAESASKTAVLDLSRITALEGDHILRATLMNSSRVPFPGGTDPNLPPSLQGGPIELPVTFELEDCTPAEGDPEPDGVGE